MQTYSTYGDILETDKNGEVNLVWLYMAEMNI